MKSTFATGWYVIAQAEELAPGAVHSMRYFGQKLVAWRGDHGVHVLDAYCPHLGADLGVGGKVVGDSIQCPFHAWRFGGDGACVEVPYASKIPARACIKTWEVRERNGLVFVWYDGLGGAPTWEIPVQPEYGSPEWTSWTINLLTVKTVPREVMENVADRAHFPRVHNTHIDAWENEFVEHRAIQRAAGVAYPQGGGSDRFKLVATYYGPAYQITEMDSRLPNVLVNAHTPVDEGTLHLRFGVMLKKTGEKWAPMYLKNLQLGYQEDVAIWENKVWRDRPMLCDGDGPIGALRRWYKQFYPEAS
jgi:3-ketosteroid 9alpha-monooxygenase subunit A